VNRIKSWIRRAEKQTAPLSVSGLVVGGLIAVIIVIVVAIGFGAHLENKKQAFIDGSQDSTSTRTDQPESFRQSQEKHKREVKALQDEVERLKAAVSNLKTERGRLVSDRNQLKVKISALQAQTLSIADSSTDLAQAADENQKLVEDNKGLREQVKRLEGRAGEQEAKEGEPKQQRAIAGLAPTPPALPVDRTQTTAQPLETYQDWGLRCLGQESGEQGQCYIYQNLIDPELGRLLGLLIGHSKQGSGLVAVITFSLAVGPQLQKGLELQIDSNKKSREEIKFDRCSTRGCSAQIELSRGLIKQLKAGARLFVSVPLHSSDKPFSFPVSLHGFTKAFDSLESRRAASQN